MKLRTKIILLSSIAVLSAMLLSNVVIWFVCARVLRRDAVQNAYYETVGIAQEFMDYAKRLHGDMDEKTAEYFFKNRKDDMTVCSFYDGASSVYYNMTVFSEDALKAFDYQYYNPDGGAGADVCVFRYQGSYYTVVRCSPQKNSGYAFYHFTDNRNMTNRLRMLAAGMAGVSVAAVLAAGLFLLLTLRHTFKPLQRLSETAALRTARMKSGWISSLKTRSARWARILTKWRTRWKNSSGHCRHRSKKKPSSWAI